MVLQALLGLLVLVDLAALESQDFLASLVSRVVLVNQAAQLGLASRSLAVPVDPWGHRFLSCLEDPPDLACLVDLVALPCLSVLARPSLLALPRVLEALVHHDPLELLVRLFRLYLHVALEFPVPPVVLERQSALLAH